MKRCMLIMVVFGILLAACSTAYKQGGISGTEKSGKTANETGISPEEEFQKLFDAGSDDIAAYMRIADALHKKENYKRAIQAYNEVLSYKPGSKEALDKKRDTYFDMGMSYEKNEKYRDAVEIYEQLRKEQPDYTPAIQSLASIYDRFGEYDKATTLYTEILNLSVKSGSTSGGNADTSVAASALKRYKDINGKAEKIFAEAQNEYKRGYYYEASDTFKKAFEIKPDFIEAKYLHYLAKGRYLLKAKSSKKDLSEAINNFYNAFITRRNDAEAYFYIGQVYQKMDQYDFVGPIEFYNKAIAAAPDTPLAKECEKKIKEVQDAKALKEKMDAFLKKKKD